MADRHPVRMGHAVVAVVPSVTTAHRCPLFGADGGLRGALTGAGDLTAVLGLFVSAKETRSARLDGASGSACSARGGCGTGCSGARAGMPRRDPMGMRDADVQISPAVATADRAVVLGASRRNRKARALRSRLAALRTWAVVADEAFLACRPRRPAALPGGSVRVAGRRLILGARTSQANQA